MLQSTFQAYTADLKIAASGLSGEKGWHLQHTEIKHVYMT